MSERRLGALVIGLLVVVGCDSGSTENNIAKAVGHVAESKDSASAKVNAAQRMKELRKNAELEADQAREAAFAAIIEVPANPPADQAATCGQVKSAYDQFLSTRLRGDELQKWNATKEPDLLKVEEACNAADPKIAACQAGAFGKVSTDFVSGDAPFILSKCEEAVAGKAPKHAAR